MTSQEIARADPASTSVTGNDAASPSAFPIISTGALLDSAPSPANLRSHYESINSILLTEPRIEAIRRELQMLLKVVQLEADGAPVDVDGFRLRSAGDWGDYPTSLSEIFWHLSSVCNFSCEFCYEKGNPPDFPIQNTPRMASPAEIATRLRHYDPVRRRGLFSVRTAINEPFANKNAVQYLRWMRVRHPRELISFVTNGAYLDRAAVQELSRLQPLFFNLSIYSVDPGIRRSVLRDFRADRAVQAVPLLREYEVPYMTNVVMWPTIPLADLERTVAYMAEYGATVMRVCLGGYSDYLPGDFPRFTVREFWPRVVDEVERLSDRYPLPILIEPNSYVRRDTEALVDGVIEGSPARLAGVRRGDMVTAVDGKPVRTRIELLSLLRRTSSSTHYVPPGVRAAGATPLEAAGQPLRLSVNRDGSEFDVTLDRFDSRAMASFPYAKIASFHDFSHGLILTDTLHYSSLSAVREILDKHRIRHALLLTSELIEPILRYMLDKTDAFRGYRVEIRVARNSYFGGTINVGDLLVVSDFIAAIEEYRDTGPDPLEAVLIPASPFASSPWGRDLSGRCWTDITRATGLPVHLIPCPSITF